MRSCTARSWRVASSRLKNGNEGIYDDAVSGLVEKALESSSEGDLLKAIEVDPSIGEAAAGAIGERCEALDYGTFEFMDRMLLTRPVPAAGAGPACVDGMPGARVRARARARAEDPGRPAPAQTPKTEQFP